MTGISKRPGSSRCFSEMLRFVIDNQEHRLAGVFNGLLVNSQVMQPDGSDGLFFISAYRLLQLTRH